MVWPSLLRLDHQLAHVAGGLRVQSQGGLVEQQDGRAGQQGAADGDALAHAGGVFLDQLVGAGGQLHALEQLLDALFGDRRGDMVERGEILQVFAPGELPVDAALAGQDGAQALAHLVGAA